MLTARDIRFRWSEEASFVFPDLAIAPGEHWLMLGPSGCGKTTYLHILAGILAPAAGEVFWRDQSVYGLSETGRDHLRGSRLGVIFQQPHLVKTLSVQENLLLAMKLAGLKPDQKEVNAILDQLGMGHRKNAKPQKLSQGERQRVSVARALVGKPELLLADEPTASLDDANCEEVVKLLESLAVAQNCALLIITHDNRLKDHFPKRIEL